MTYDDEHLGQLLRALPPVPERVVARAQELFAHLPSEGETVSDDGEPERADGDSHPDERHETAMDDDSPDLEPDAWDDDLGEPWT